MKKPKPPADDPRFHHEIWSGPTPESADTTSGIYYVENHNGQCSYAELALDFKMAADLTIQEYRQTQLGNWTAPVAHLVRQTVELRLKALLDTIVRKGGPADPKLAYSHDLEGIWERCHDWLAASGYKFRDDARMTRTVRLIEALHAIDPSGDLFRFGISNQTAFGKQKSYDRVGLRMNILVPDFEAADGFLSHWEAVLLREIIAVEMGWETDPYFDAGDFPKSPAATVSMPDHVLSPNPEGCSEEE
jgi:hypothetical protein